MAVRVVNGNTFTEDGWPLVDQDGCTWIHVPGASVSLQIQSGVPARVLGAWVADWNAYVEPVYDADSASWTAGNSVLGQPGRNNGSNHLGGTAVDLRWQSHPWKVRNGGLNAAQLNTIREMLDWYEGCIYWGGNWPDAYVDPMHSQMGSLSSGDVATYANGGPTPHVLDFIARKIRADGYSTFRRGNAPAHPPAAQVLADATGLGVDRAGVILPTVISGLQASACNNVNRIAMWLAQCGEESAGFSTTTEFASGAEYEGRCSDLGNCSPGDGVKYKGRTWIQITGKAHYAEFSRWAFGKGLCLSPTQFVDNPASLGDLPWAGIGAAWYWTVSRPDINALSDGGDVLTVTKRINGGTNGLTDRQNRYNRAHALGDQLLTLTSPTQEDDLTPEQDQMLRAINRELTQRLPSRSPLRWLDQKAHYPDGLVDTMAGFELNIDGMTHVQYCVELASYNHPPTVALLNEVAGADPGQYPDRADDIKLAQAILNKVAADKVGKAVASSSSPVVVNGSVTQAQVQQIASAVSAAASAVTAQQAVAPVTVGGTTGQLIGQAFDSLEALKGAQSDLSPQAKATVDALIGVLQSETGVKA